MGTSDRISTSQFRDKYVQLAQDMDLFHGIPPDVLVKVMSLGLTKAVEKDTLIFNKGDLGDSMYVILAGKVEVIDHNKVIASLERGDMFGEMGLLSREPRSATAIAREDTSLFILSENALNKLLTKTVAIRLLLNTIGEISSRLRKANRMLSERG
ncbi:MAG: cyclic nucleotide-binding domain-containing protein [Candidatus Hydrogenedentes bacterium]|nr:cyclic nucleotide-binding domain-containing protein [Candidatus Hydrogenedentota bacterium]